MSVEQQKNHPDQPELQHLRNTLQKGSVSPGEQKQIARFLQDQQQKLVDLQEQLRKQEHDFTTVMEMSNQIIARSVDSSGLDDFISYIRSTFQGHFGVEDVYIIHRKGVDTDLLSPARNDAIDVTIPCDSALAAYLSQRDQPVSLQTASAELGDVPELQNISNLNVEMVLGLTRRMNTNNGDLHGILLLGPKIVEESYSQADKQFLSLLGRMIAISLHNAGLYQKSIHDSLTGLYTRGHFDLRLKEKIDTLLQSDRPEERPLSIIIMDLDHFKRINDEFGHQTGDRILQSTSDTLLRNTRPDDILARYGGEEFILSAPDTDQEHGTMIAERLRKKVKEMTISVNGKSYQVTVSAGVSTFPSNSKDAKTLIAKADDALYKAKENGRDRVVPVKLQ